MLNDGVHADSENLQHLVEVWEAVVKRKALVSYLSINKCPSTYHMYEPDQVMHTLCMSWFYHL